MEFVVPEPGSARVEIVAADGSVIDRLVDGPVKGGAHLAIWRSAVAGPGARCRLTLPGSVVLASV